jgi:6-phosphofructokinase
VLAFFHEIAIVGWRSKVFCFLLLVAGCLPLPAIQGAMSLTTATKAALIQLVNELGVPLSPTSNTKAEIVAAIWYRIAALKQSVVEKNLQIADLEAAAEQHAQEREDAADQHAADIFDLRGEIADLKAKLEQHVGELVYGIDEHADPMDGTVITVKHVRRGVLTAERDIHVTANMSFGAVSHQATIVADELAGLNDDDVAQTDLDAVIFKYTTYGDTATASWVGLCWGLCGRFRL